MIGGTIVLFSFIAAFIALLCALLLVVGYLLYRALRPIAEGAVSMG